MSGVYFRRPPGPHFLRNRVGMTWPKSCVTAQARADRILTVFGKVVPAAAFFTIVRSFRVPDRPTRATFGAKSGQVWQVASVSFSESWKPMETDGTDGNGRNPAQN